MAPQITATTSRIHPSVRFGHEVVIEADELELGEGVVIGSQVVLRARKIQLGAGTQVGDRVQLNSLRGGLAERWVMGHQCLLGNDCRLALPTLVCGDYVNIHNHGLLNGAQPMVLGHNCWVGQNCVLNSDSLLWVGNHVGIGAYSCLYTHAYWGDVLEGCTLCKSEPVVVEDDCWIVGSYNVIAPGLQLGARSIVLTGSMVSRSVLPEQVVGGAPARPLQRSKPMYVKRSLEEKLDMMAGYLDEFASFQGLTLEKGISDWYFPEHDAVFWVASPSSRAAAFRLGIVAHASNPPPCGEGLIELGQRRYFPSRHPMEVRLLKFLKSYRARFVPADQPVVGGEFKPTF